MVRTFQAALTGVVALLAMPGAGCQSGPGRAQEALPFKVGQAFPALVLPAIDSGHPRSITEFRGQKLILHIFASW